MTSVPLISLIAIVRRSVRREYNSTNNNQTVKTNIEMLPQSTPIISRSRFKMVQFFQRYEPRHNTYKSWRKYKVAIPLAICNLTFLAMVFFLASEESLPKKTPTFRVTLVPNGTEFAHHPCICSRTVVRSLEPMEMCVTILIALLSVLLWIILIEGIRQFILQQKEMFFPCKFCPSNDESLSMLSIIEIAVGVIVVEVRFVLQKLMELQMDIWLMFKKTIALLKYCLTVLRN